MSVARQVANEWHPSGKLGVDIAYKEGAEAVSSSCVIEFQNQHCFQDLIMRSDSEVEAALLNVGAIVIEVCERTIRCDLILGRLKQIVDRNINTSLKILVNTVSSSNLLHLSSFFGRCPIFRLSGSHFPVEVSHHEVHPEEGMPPKNGNTEMEAYYYASVQKVMDLYKNSGSGSGGAGGGILCFLTSSREVKAARHWVSKRAPNAEVFALYDSKDPTTDRKCLRLKTKSNKRKIVFAIDIAETLLVVNGIHHVVDCGHCYCSTFDQSRNTTRLVLAPITKVKAQHRTNCAGVSSPG
jgi:HrpA-like RNA helicase